MTRFELIGENMAFFVLVRDCISVEALYESAVAIAGEMYELVAGGLSVEGAILDEDEGDAVKMSFTGAVNPSVGDNGVVSTAAKLLVVNKSGIAVVASAAAEVLSAFFAWEVIVWVETALFLNKSEFIVMDSVFVEALLDSAQDVLILLKSMLVLKAEVISTAAELEDASGVLIMSDNVGVSDTCTKVVFISGLL